MALFPFFVNIEGKEGLIIGTGKHAQEKIIVLQKVRPEIARTLTDKKQRFKFYYKLSQICMEENRALTEEEFRGCLLWHVQSAKKNLQE